MADKTLVIVESPAKAKTINKFLGSRYVVTSSMGHVIDLPKSKMGVDVENNFEPQYITIRGKGTLLKEIKKEAKKAKNILVATDPDREGEAIAWHLQRALGLPEDSKTRIEFNEITKDAIKEAVKNPRTIDIHRVEAQQARRVLDRLVGYSLSPLLWKKVKKGLSAGRVQSVAVRIIIEREEEIDKFVPEEYWKLTAKFLKDEMEFEAGLTHVEGKKAEITSEEDMKQILDMLADSEYQVKKVVRKDKKKNPGAPYTTSSLQQDASRKMGFSAKKTMRFSQQLYEGVDLGRAQGGTVGLITYIRTDSTRVSSQAQEETKTFIEEKYGKEFLPEKFRTYSAKKNAQDAHEAIRPTYVDKTPELLKDKLSKDQFRLYKLIWTRFVCSQMASAIIDSLTVDIEAAEARFRANGSRVKFLGYLNLDKDARKSSTEVSLPVLEEEESLIPKELAPTQHFTQPPARFNEASLVKTLEEKGIGRPSTYATIIDTIVRRGYVLKDAKLFYSTELGRIVLDVLQSSFTTVLDPTFTADMESKLDGVEEGTNDWKAILKDFYGPFSAELEKAEKEVAKIEIKDEVSDVICEKCGRNMVYKMGRYGKFLACPGFPDCRNTKPIIKSTGKICPKCGGDIIEKKSKTGKIFYGCEKYPDCDFVSWDLPIEEKCPTCSYPLAQKGKRYGGYKYCLSDDCEYTEQKKKAKKKDTKKA
jgi:DNA topoisomerase-1